MVWFLSPSGWPTHADSVDEEWDLEDRGYTPIDEGDVAGAIAAYRAGQPAAPENVLTMAEAAAAIGASGNPLGDAARAAFVPVYSAVQAQQYRTRESGDRLVNVQPRRFGALTDPGFHPLVVRRDIRGQEFLGAGASVSDATAWLAKNKLTAQQRHDLLTHLYGPVADGHCGWSTMRVSFGATNSFRSPDSPTVYNYDPMVTNALDLDMSAFSIAADTWRTIPVIKEIVGINPQVRIHATTSVRPPWMVRKDFGWEYLRDDVPSALTDPAARALNGAVSKAFAAYCVKAIQAWEALGIPIYSFTPINEPFYGAIWPPSLIADFINNHLGPAMRDAGLKTKLLVGEDNYDQAEATATIMRQAGQWIDGASWHAYMEQVPELGRVAAEFPGKSHHITEIRNLLTEGWGAAWGVAMGRTIIGGSRFGASSFTAWNLFLDENGGPEVSGNTPNRQGVITVPDSGSGAVVYNTFYWALNHLTRFVRTGARQVGIDSWNSGWYTGGDVMACAWENPDGTIAVIAHNGSTSAAKTFNVVDGATHQGFPVTLEAGETSTFVWGSPAHETVLGAAPVVGAIPAPPVVTGTPGKAQAALSWTVPTSNVPLSRYEILRDGAQIAAVAADQTTYTDRQLAAGTYAYTVRAVNAAGTGPASAAASVTVAAVTVPAEIAKPTVTVVGRRVVLSWVNPAGESYDSIAIWRSSTAGQLGAQIATLSGTATSFTHTPPLDTTLYYTVRPSNSAGPKSSIQSDGVSVTTANARPATLHHNNGTAHIDWAASYQTRRVGLLTNAVRIPEDAVKPAVVAAVMLSATTPPTAVAARFGGAAMTLLGTVTSGARRVALYGLTNPRRGISEAVVDVAGVGGAWTLLGVMAFTNVDQANPFGAPVTAAVAAATTGSVDTTGGAATDTVALFGCMTVDASGVGASQTRLDNSSSGGSHAIGTTYPLVTVQAGGTGTVTSSVTLASAGDAALIALPIKAALT